jgi:hypothetical protein
MLASPVRAEGGVGREQVMKRIGAIVAAGVALLALSACDEAVENAAERLAESQTTDDVDFDLDDGKIRIGDSEVTFGSELPSDFPSDVPLPEGGELVGGGSGTDGNSAAWSLLYSGLDASDIASYRDSVVGAGFEIQSSTTEDNGEVSGFSATGNGYEILAGANPEGFGLTVTQSS